MRPFSTASKAWVAWLTALAVGVSVLVGPPHDISSEAWIALALLGTKESNEAVAGRLRDDDPEVRQLATDALWKIWFRGDSEVNNLDLQRLSRTRDRQKAAGYYEKLVALASKADTPRPEIARAKTFIGAR